MSSNNEDPNNNVRNNTGNRVRSKEKNIETQKYMIGKEADVKDKVIDTDSQDNDDNKKEIDLRENLAISSRKNLVDKIVVSENLESKTSTGIKNLAQSDHQVGLENHINIEYMDLNKTISIDNKDQFYLRSKKYTDSLLNYTPKKRMSGNSIDSNGALVVPNQPTQNYQQNLIEKTEFDFMDFIGKKVQNSQKHEPPIVPKINIAVHENNEKENIDGISLGDLKINDYRGEMTHQRTRSLTILTESANDLLDSLDQVIGTPQQTPEFTNPIPEIGTSTETLPTENERERKLEITRLQNPPLPIPLLTDNYIQSRDNDLLNDELLEDLPTEKKNKRKTGHRSLSITCGQERSTGKSLLMQSIIYDSINNQQTAKSLIKKQQKSKNESSMFCNSSQQNESPQYPAINREHAANLEFSRKGSEDSTKKYENLTTPFARIIRHDTPPNSDSFISGKKERKNSFYEKKSLDRRYQEMKTSFQDSNLQESNSNNKKNESKAQQKVSLMVAGDTDKVKPTPYLAEDRLVTSLTKKVLDMPMKSNFQLENQLNKYKYLDNGDDMMIDIPGKTNTSPVIKKIMPCSTNEDLASTADMQVGTDIFKTHPEFWTMNTSNNSNSKNVEDTYNIVPSQKQIYTTTVSNESLREKQSYKYLSSTLKYFFGYLIIKG